MCAYWPNFITVRLYSLWQLSGVGSCILQLLTVAKLRKLWCPWYHRCRRQSEENHQDENRVMVLIWLGNLTLNSTVTTSMKWILVLRWVTKVTHRHLLNTVLIIALICKISLLYNSSYFWIVSFKLFEIAADIIWAVKRFQQFPNNFFVHTEVLWLHSNCLSSHLFLKVESTDDYFTN